ncbi:hypothetical protein D3C75_973060 [compost metagenome]
MVHQFLEPRHIQTQTAAVHPQEIGAFRHHGLDCGKMLVQIVHGKVQVTLQIHQQLVQPGFTLIVSGHDHVRAEKAGHMQRKGLDPVVDFTLQLRIGGHHESGRQTGQVEGFGRRNGGNGKLRQFR